MRSTTSIGGNSKPLGDAGVEAFAGGGWHLVKVRGKATGESLYSNSATGENLNAIKLKS